MIIQRTLKAKTEKESWRKEKFDTLKRGKCEIDKYMRRNNPDAQKTL